MNHLLLLFLLLPFSSRANEDLIAHYSPVIYQDIGRNPRADFIGKVDYDGDSINDNNWENLDKYPIQASLYYSLIETQSHYFITYAIFHPRDYARYCCIPKVCHENDLEGIKITVLKDGSQYGKLRLVETIAHGNIEPYPVAPGIASDKVKLHKPFLVDDDSHPIIYVQDMGHGVYAAGEDTIAGCKSCLRYYHDDDQNYEPMWPQDNLAFYSLEPIFDNFWQILLERDNGIYANYFEFTNPLTGDKVSLPASMSGDNYSDNAANLPWGWKYDGKKLPGRGTWFLDPAHSLKQIFLLPEPISTEYLENEFLETLLP